VALRARAPAVIVAAAVVLLSGCGGSGKSGDTTTTVTTAGTTVAAGCAPAPANVVRRIARGVVLVGGKLVRPQMVPSSELHGYFLVSARVPQIAPRAVATWATKGIDPIQQVIAVDENAIEISEFGSGFSHQPPITLDTAGAQKSRDCVFRGTG
jgi:hypothetical protein